MLYSEGEGWRIYNGDCIEVMRSMEDDSVDSIVTDPPYELGFMGKKWDASGIAYNVEAWKEALRILKPGGHLLAFGGTRTYHRMTCAIEDAGFEIRDCIQWLYGTGFPKSMNVSKAIDKAAGSEREVIGYDASRARPNRTGKVLGEKEYDRSDNGATLTAPATEEAKEWDGWGTALKPANEPIVLARKPLSEKTIAANVLKWGTGALNIDDCRVEPTGERLGGGGEKRATFQGKEGWGRPWMDDAEKSKAHAEKVQANVEKATQLGRFPANVILDEEAAEALDEQSGELKSGKSDGFKGPYKANVYGKYANNVINPENIYGDKGGASRFFYVPKASKKERTCGGEIENKHPTVKPIELMGYLCRMVTPPGGTVLDPFAGSGTTILAAQKEGFHAAGIDQSEEYCELSTQRIKANQ